VQKLGSQLRSVIHCFIDCVFLSISRVALRCSTVLGERHFWNVATASLVETDAVRVSFLPYYPALLETPGRFIPGSPLFIVKLIAQLGLVFIVGLRAEQLVQPSSTRVGYTVAIAALVSGVCVSFGSLMGYLSTTDETFLYKPLWGAGPVSVALAVAAHQVCCWS
jgi:FtsH-binding integral membrane protein